MFIPTWLSLLSTFLGASLGMFFNSITHFFEIPRNLVHKDVDKPLAVNLSQTREIRWQTERFVASINSFSFLGDKMILVEIPKERNGRL